MSTGRIVNFRGLGQCLVAALGVYAMGAAVSAFGALDASGCAVFGIVEWVALEVLRTVIHITIWQEVTTHSCQGVSWLPQMLQMGTHIWSLLGQLG